MLSRLNRTDYNNIDSNEIGLYPNLAYGSLKDIRSHAIESGAAALLAADISADAITFSVDQVEGFPATPFTIQCQEERMRVTDITNLVMTVTRGYDSTQPAAHIKNKTIYEVKTSYIYLVADHPVKAIGDVYIDGSRQVSRYTAYTGKSGDSHPSYADKAVIAFTAEPYIAPQFNLEYAAEKEQGTRITIYPDIASNPLLSDNIQESFADTYMVITSGETISVKFPPGYGSIIKQRYSVQITPDDLVVDDDIVFSVSVTESGTLKAYTNKYLGRSELYRIGGAWDDVLKISNQGKDLRIGQIFKEVIKKNERYTVGSDTNTATHDPAIITHDYNQDGQPSYVTYSASSPITDATIVSQTHYASITLPALTSYARARISAVDPSTNDVLAFKDYYFNKDTDSSGEMSVTHDGGGWDVITKVTLQHDIEVDPYTFYKTVTYTTPEIIGAAAYATSSSAKVVIGNRISVDAEFAVDQTGDYGGAGTLIERPDHVIEHFLITQKGAGASDIDSTSFAAAGTLYSTAISGGYKLNFLWDPKINEDRMAAESRSIIYMTQGKYYLDFVPDTAPASLMTIPEEDTIGPDGFVFNHGIFEDLYNDFTARYGPLSNGEWSGVVSSTDGSSKYSTRSQQADLLLITLETMAQDVLDNILLQNKKLYKTVEFTTTWKYQSLKIGDTFDIESEIHTGTKFFVEKILINSNNTITITGKEWW